MSEHWVAFWQLGTLELVNQAVALLLFVLSAVKVLGNVRQLGLEFLELLESDRLVVSFLVEYCQHIPLRLLLLVHLH